MTPEVVLAAGYAGLLIAGAFVLEWLSAHTHRRSLRYRTAGFAYDEDHDHWECPQGEHLWPHEFDDERRLVRYRAKAHVCNACPLKDACTDSDHGREIVRPLDPWPHSEAGRFHRGIALLMVALGLLIVVVEAVRHHAGLELALLAGVLVAGALAGTLAGARPAHAPGELPRAEPLAGPAHGGHGRRRAREGPSLRMKRSAALAALSRDHHHALEAARRLRRADAGDLDAARRPPAGVLGAARTPALRDRGASSSCPPCRRPTPTGARPRRASATSTRGSAPRSTPARPGRRGDGVEAAHALGTLLHDHVRFEERHLFGLLEARLPERDLARLGEAIERAEAGEA